MESNESMGWEEERNRAGLYLIILGVLSLLGAGLLLLAATQLRGDDATLLQVLVGLNAVIGAASVAVGLAVRRGRHWARIGGLALAVVIGLLAAWDLIELLMNFSPAIAIALTFALIRLGMSIRIFVDLRNAESAFSSG